MPLPFYLYLSRIGVRYKAKLLNKPEYTTQNTTYGDKKVYTIPFNTVAVAGSVSGPLMQSNFYMSNQILCSIPQFKNQYLFYIPNYQ